MFRVVGVLLLGLLALGMLVSRLRPTARSAASRAMSRGLALGGRLVAVKRRKASDETVHRVVEVTDTVHLSESLKVYGGTDAAIEVVRVVDTLRSSSADLNTDGSVDYSIHGVPPRNEEGVIQVCQTLIERLNRYGTKWEAPILLAVTSSRDEEGIDCRSCSGTEVLNIQVTRVLYEDSGFRTLHKTGSIEGRGVDTGRLAQRLREAISKKQSVPPRQRTNVVLAIDATDTSAMVLDQTIQSFRRDHGSWAQGLGFQAVWIVGPTADLVARIDAYPEVHAP